MRRLSFVMIGAGALLLTVCGVCYLEAAAFQSLATSHGLGGIARLLGMDTASLSAGRIEIARIGLAAAIREGTDTQTLLLAVGHVPGTAIPGQEGNVVLTGHRDSFFRRLKLAREGDKVSIAWGGGLYHYKIESTSIVERHRTEVMDPLGGRTLTLITCYPFGYIGRAPQRFVVRARQIAPSPAEQAGRAAGITPA